MLQLPGGYLFLIDADGGVTQLQPQGVRLQRWSGDTSGFFLCT
ncbi:MAG: hypothetical protein ABSC16_13525 [Candidatus Dormibacteria bacterium]|jgi:hypothetical protein